MANCFTCGQEITFDKNIRSKTGKQIPLWIDKQNTHGHDEDGNAIRGPLPATAGQGLQTPRTEQITKPQFVKEPGTNGINVGIPPAPTNNPSLEAVLLSQVNTAISTLTKLVEEQGKSITALGEKLEYNTQVDTNKLIGQLQTISDTITPFLSTQMKVGTELYEEQQKRQKQAQEEKYRKEQEEQARWNNKKPLDPKDSRTVVEEEEVVVEDNEEEIQEDAL